MYLNLYVYLSAVTNQWHAPYSHSAMMPEKERNGRIDCERTNEWINGCMENRIMSRWARNLTCKSAPTNQQWQWHPTTVLLSNKIRRRCERMCTTWKKGIYILPMYCKVRLKMSIMVMVMMMVRNWMIGGVIAKVLSHIWLCVFIFIESEWAATKE